LLQAPVVPVYRLPRPRLDPLDFKPAKPPRRHGDAGAPFAVGIGGGMRFRNGSGYRKLGDADRQSEFDLFGSYDVYQPMPRIVFAVGLNYRYGHVGDSDLLVVKSHTAQAELNVRYTLTTWLFPHVRGGVGVITSVADFSDAAGSFSASDRSTGATGSLGGGFTLRTPRRLFETRGGHLASLSIGLLVEAGYVFAPTADYTLRPKSNADVEQSSISLGKLEQGGAYLRFLAVVRF
jgi:hypothetical protein